LDGWSDHNRPARPPASRRLRPPPISD